MIDITGMEVQERDIVLTKYVKDYPYACYNCSKRFKNIREVIEVKGLKDLCCPDCFKTLIIKGYTLPEDTTM